MRRLLGAAALILLMGAGSANAASVTVIASSSQGAPNTGVNTANVYGAAYQGNVPTGASFSVDPLVGAGQGSNSGNFKSPFANTVKEGVNSYFSVGGGFGAPQGTPTSPVSLSTTAGSFARAATLLWGSIDSYNKLEFFNGATLVGSFDGTFINGLLAALPQYNGTNFEKVALLQFRGFGPGGFNKAVFTSTQQAFEFGLANGSLTPLLSPVPIPAALPLFGTAIGGLYFLKRRQRRNSTPV